MGSYSINDLLFHKREKEKMTPYVGFTYFSLVGVRYSAVQNAVQSSDTALNSESPEMLFYSGRPLTRGEKIQIKIDFMTDEQRQISWGITNTAADTLQTYLGPPYCKYECTYRTLKQYYGRSVKHTDYYDSTHSIRFEFNKNETVSFTMAGTISPIVYPVGPGPWWLYIFVAGPFGVRVTADYDDNYDSFRKLLIGSPIHAGLKTRKKFRIMRRHSVSDLNEAKQQKKQKAITKKAKETKALSTSPVNPAMVRDCLRDASVGDICYGCGGSPVHSVLYPCGHLSICEGCNVWPPETKVPCPICWAVCTCAVKIPV